MKKFFNSPFGIVLTISAICGIVFGVYTWWNKKTAEKDSAIKNAENVAAKAATDEAMPKLPDTAPSNVTEVAMPEKPAPEKGTGNTGINGGANTANTLTSFSIPIKL